MRKDFVVLNPDGEVIGQTPLEVRVVPGAVRVVTPRVEERQ